MVTLRWPKHHRNMFETRKGLIFNQAQNQFNIYRRQHFWSTVTSLEQITERGNVLVQYQGVRQGSPSVYWSVTGHRDQIRFWPQRKTDCIREVQKDRSYCVSDTSFDRSNRDQLDRMWGVGLCGELLVLVVA